ncbi:unnamed protein product [Euphydryas editha]|uniref:Uncharacterized protein n=1 Tax=Euphydryas editha TaxID=104508 RepID=A0AAU9UPF2_EUPED|nr:unnamed protein product [Euphydryas editha]
MDAELPDFVPFGPDQVNNEQTLRILERDMESSKQGPELENGAETRDQASQTDEYLIHNYPVNKSGKDEPKNDRTKENGNGNGGGRDEKREQRSKEKDEVVPTKESSDKQEQRSKEKDEVVPTKQSSDKQETTLEGDSDRPEEENNGGWWRYLYPFYYFV